VTREWHLKGWHVLTAALSFFALVIGANVVMVSFALNTFSGADTDDAYRKGLSYNEALERKAEAAEAGWDARVAVERGSSSAANVSVRLTRRNEAAGGLAVTATLRHPADAHRDRSVTLAYEGDGRYAGSFDGVARGNWVIEIGVREDDRAVLETRQRTWLP